MKTSELARKEVSEQVLFEQGKEKEICRERWSTVEHWLLKTIKGILTIMKKYLVFAFVQIKVHYFRFLHGIEIYSRGFNLLKGINISKAQESWFTNYSVVLNNVYVLVKKTKNQ